MTRLATRLYFSIVAFLGLSLSAVAQAEYTCKVSKGQLKTNPTYKMVAEATGGQIFTLSSEDLAKPNLLISQLNYTIAFLHKLLR